MIKSKFNLIGLAAGIFLCLQVIGLLVILVSPLPAAAQNNADITQSLQFTPQISVPGSKITGTVDVGTYNAASGTMVSDLLPRYIIAFYNYGLAIAGILATIVLMGGGIVWLMSGGDSGKIGQAKELITGSIIGLVILVVAWVILNTINPNLVNLKSLETIVIKRVSYCCDPLIGNVIMTKDGKCPEGNSVKCADNQQCKNDGDNKFVCASDQGSYCCEYRDEYSANHGGPPRVSCRSIPFDNKTKCPAAPSGFIYSKSYPNFYCGNKTIAATDCKAGNCIGKDPGDTCDNTFDGFCYNEACYTGEGTEGQPCGTEQYSKCDKDTPQGGKTCVGDMGARDCGTGLWCCKFRSDGTRVNKT